VAVAVAVYYHESPIMWAYLPYFWWGRHKLTCRTFGGGGTSLPAVLLGVGAAQARPHITTTSLSPCRRFPPYQSPASSNTHTAAHTHIHMLHYLTPLHLVRNVLEELGHSFYHPMFFFLAAASSLLVFASSQLSPTTLRLSFSLSMNSFLFLLN
jgi:hypothetical protein